MGVGSGNIFLVGKSTNVRYYMKKFDLLIKCNTTRFDSWISISQKSLLINHANGHSEGHVAPVVVRRDDGSSSVNSYHRDCE